MLRLNLEDEIINKNVVAVDINSFKTIVPANEENKTSTRATYQLTTLKKQYMNTSINGKTIYTILYKKDNGTYIEYFTGKEVRVLDDSIIYESTINKLKDQNSSNTPYKLVNLESLQNLPKDPSNTSSFLTKNDIKEIDSKTLHGFYIALQKRSDIKSFLETKITLYERIIKQILLKEARFLVPFSEIKRAQFYICETTEDILIKAEEFNNPDIPLKNDLYCIFKEISPGVYLEVNSGLTITYINLFGKAEPFMKKYNFYKENPLVTTLKLSSLQTINVYNEDKLIYNNPDEVREVLQMLKEDALFHIEEFNNDFINHSFEQATAENKIYDFLKLMKLKETKDKKN